MLFNKNNNGSEEIYNLTGTFHAATDFKSIQADVAAAEMEVGDIVGEAVMTEAQEAYDNDGDLKLLDAVRLPIAILAVAYYARKTGLSVGETGRKIKVDENEKVPFEWMIDRDNLEMKERYYRAIDMLFRYLEKSGKQPVPRFNLTVVKTIQDFEAVYPIHGSRYTLQMMFPLLQEAEASLMAKVKEDICSREMKAAAGRYIVLSALVIALKRWSLSVFPVEIARHFSPSHEGNRETKPATASEINWQIEQFTTQAESALQELRRLQGDFHTGSTFPANRKKNKFFTV